MYTQAILCHNLWIILHKTCVILWEGWINCLMFLWTGSYWIFYCLMPLLNHLSRYSWEKTLRFMKNCEWVELITDAALHYWIFHLLNVYFEARLALDTQQPCSYNWVDTSIIQPFIKISMGTCLVLYTIVVIVENYPLGAHCWCRDMLLNCVTLTNPREIQSNQDSIMAFICLKKTSHAYVILFNQTWRHWLNNVHIRQGELSSGAKISGLKAQSSPEPLRGRWSLPRCFCSCWWSLAVSASPPPPPYPPLPPPPRPHPSPCLSFPPCKVWTDTTVL